MNTKKALEEEFHLIDQAEKHQKHHEHLLRVELNEAIIKGDKHNEETEEK